jgi:transcriptional regulator with XRE-family HTH domain
MPAKKIRTNGKLFQFKRLAQGFSQDDVARIAKVTTRIVSDIERGIGAVPEIADAVAKSVGLTFEQLISSEHHIIGVHTKKTLDDPALAPFIEGLKGAFSVSYVVVIGITPSQSTTVWMLFPIYDIITILSFYAGGGGRGFEQLEITHFLIHEELPMPFGYVARWFCDYTTYRHPPLYCERTASDNYFMITQWQIGAKGDALIPPQHTGINAT